MSERLCHRCGIMDPDHEIDPGVWLCTPCFNAHDLEKYKIGGGKVSDIVERLRWTANAGIPDFTNSKLLDEAADEIERLREDISSLTTDLVLTEHEVKRLRVARGGKDE